MLGDGDRGDLKGNGQGTTPESQVGGVLCPCFSRTLKALRSNGATGQPAPQQGALWPCFSGKLSLTPMAVAYFGGRDLLRWP